MSVYLDISASMPYPPEVSQRICKKFEGRHQCTDSGNSGGDLMLEMQLLVQG